MPPSTAAGVLALVVFLVAARIAWIAFVHLRRWQRVKAAPTVKIETVSPGALVEVVGKAVCDKPVLSPFSGEECVECRWSISLPRRHKGHLHWDVTASSVLIADGFAVQDVTGKLPIAKGALHTLYLQNAQGFTTEKPIRSIDEIKASLTAQGLKDTQFVEGWCQFHEDILRPGDPLYVLGTVNERREIFEGDNGEVLIGNMGDEGMRGRLEKEFRPRMILATCLALPSLYGLWWWLGSEELVYAIRYRLGF